MAGLTPTHLLIILVIALSVISPVVIGGTSLFGGAGSVFGTAVGTALDPKGCSGTGLEMGSRLVPLHPSLPWEGHSAPRVPLPNRNGGQRPMSGHSAVPGHAIAKSRVGVARTA